MDLIPEIILGLGVAGLAVAIIILVRAQSQVTPQLVAYGKALVEAIKNQSTVETERDEWKIRAVKAEAERASMSERLTQVTDRLTKVLEEEASDAVEEIRSAPTAVDALDALNRLFQRVPSLPPSGDAGKTSG